MSEAVMALAETSRSYQKRIKELEDEVATLQEHRKFQDAFILNCGINDGRNKNRIEELQSECGNLDWEVKKLRLDCAEAREYGHALYQSFREVYSGSNAIPKPPWLLDSE